MLVIYGSPLCPDCRNAKLNFDQFGIEYSYKDINENLRNLKEFLAYRDGYPEVFDRLKKMGDIGIPCCVLDGKVFTDWEKYLRDLGYAELAYEGAPISCSIDGKGC